MTSTQFRGLSSAEAAELLERVGPNELHAAGHAWWTVLLHQLKSPLLGLLVAAAAVSIGVGEGLNGEIILAIMALSVGLGFYDEYRSERTVAALQARVGRRATVVRDGHPQDVPAAELVPGDLVLLEPGDIVPADLELSEAKALTVDESTLTGEAFPAEKQEGDGVSSGTVVRTGTGAGIATATGGATRLGKIAGALGAAAPTTAFQKGLNSFARLLWYVTASLTIFIFVANALLGRPLLESLLFSLAIAVGLTPQLLPAIVTVSLSTGARRMAEQSVLVRRLVSIEDLGDTEILFTDKTGTLTSGEIVLEEVVGPDGAPAPSVLLDAALASTGRGPLDAAVLAEAGGPPPGRIVLDVPFDYERRSSTVVVEAADGSRRLLCKGAPEELLARCAGVPAEAQATLDGMLDAGLRVLAVAGRTVEGENHDETGIALLGFLGFSDPPKADAAGAVARLARLGVELKILTGDHERSAARVCERLGVPVKGTARGDDLESLDDPALAELISRTTVFARVSPEQKARIVKAAQHPGTDVAFLGDGVNDALALRQADVGISVDTAMDVAREAADVVLLEKSLDVLANGVVEGRRIFANTMKYILMGTSSNFGNMFSAAAASLFLSFLPMLPSQILLNNLLYDTSEMTIPTDNVDEELLRRPAHWDIGFIRRFMLFFGPISSLYDFMTFGVMLWVFDAGPELFRSGWFVESLCTQALVIFVIRTRRIPFFHSRPSRPLLFATLAVAAVAIAIPYSALAAPLGFVAPPAPFLGILGVMIVTYLGLVEAGKWVFYRRFAPRP